MADRWIEISVRVTPELVTWPGVVEGFERASEASFEAGDGMEVSRLHMGAHTGTHVDTPRHFIRGAGDIESYPLDAFVGPAVVLAIPDGDLIVTSDHLEAIEQSRPERVLFRTTNSGWSTRETEFREDYVALDESAAQWCVDRGVKLVGVDYLSVEPFDADQRNYPVHKTLLGAGIVVLEGLDLAGVETGDYELVALPLLIPGSDGAPARALLARV